MAQEHIYSQISLQRCPALDAIEVTNMYIDGFCKIYFPKEAFIDGDVSVIIQSLDIPDAPHTTEQILSSEITPAIFPAYSYSSYTFSTSNGNCPPSPEQKLLCLPPEDPSPILSNDAIAILYVLYNAEIKEILHVNSLSNSEVKRPEHPLGFFDGIFQEHNVLSTLLSHTLSSSFGRHNLALIQFLQQEPTTTGYWAQALSNISEFDVVDGLFSPAYTATLRKKENEDGSFRLTLVVVHESGDVVINMDSQLYRSSTFIPLNKNDVQYKNTETLSEGVDIYIRHQPGIAVLFNYFAQPGRGSNRGESCLDYIDILGQHCTSYSSGQNLCPIQSKVTKNDLSNAIAERPIYLSTAEAEGDWMKVFTLEAGDLLNMCGYWMTDQPALPFAQETDGKIYFANKSRALPLAFFLLIVVGFSVVCTCITIIFLFIISCCPRLKLYAVDLHWTPYKVPLSGNPKKKDSQGKVKELTELLVTKTDMDMPVMHISPLFPKTMSPFLLPRGNVTKKLTPSQNKHRLLALAMAGTINDVAAEFPFNIQDPSSVTKDSTHSSTNADSMANSMLCMHSTNSMVVFSDDRRNVEVSETSEQLE